MRRFRRRDDEQGAISIMAALMAVATLVATSLAVDVGRVAYVSRDQQGLTDRAALDVISELRDHTETSQLGLYDLAVAAADRVAAWNPGADATAGGSRSVNGLVLGTESGGEFHALCGVEPAWIQAQRAEDDELEACSSTALASQVTAVEVFTASTVPFVFAIGSEESSKTVNKRSRASFGNPIGSVSAASTLVTLSEDQDDLVPALLRALLGADADVDLVGWNGLANVTVTLRELGLRLDVGTLEELLDTEVTVAELADVTAQVLTNRSAEPDVAVETTLADLVGLGARVTLGSVRLGDIIKVDPSSGSSALDATIDTGSLLMALGQRALVDAAVANDENFARVSLGVDGLVDVELQLIQAPQVAIGRPGKDGDEWRTEARTSQARLNVGLPLYQGTYENPFTGEFDVVDVREEIAAIETCNEAVWEASTTSGSIRSQVQAAIDAYEQAASLLGIVTDTLVAPIIQNLTGLLGGLAGTLECGTSWLSGTSSTEKRDEIKLELQNLVDAYEAVVAEVAAAFGPEGGTKPRDETPVLSVALASGTVALESIGCTDPYAVGVVGQGSLGDVVLTSTAALEADSHDPAPVPVTLLDVDLGALGRLSASLETDVSLGGEDLAAEHTFEEALPSAPYRFTSPGLGLEGVTSGLVVKTAGTQVLGLPVGSATDPVIKAITDTVGAVLAPVDTLVASTLDVLGLDLNEVEARALSATCEGPARLLANP